MAVEINKNNTFTRTFDIDVLSEKLIIHQKLEGDVNCVVWDAAIVLAKYLEELYKKDENVFKNLDIIELGSGLGCVGLVSASLGANVLLTDLKETIPLLRFNIDENKKLCKGTVNVLELRWGENNLKYDPDKILLADCIYYKESIEPLIETLKYYSTKKTEIILAQELRDSDKQKENWRYFLDRVKKSFCCVQIPLSEQNLNYSSEDIVILKLYRI